MVNKKRLINQFIELVKINSETKHEQKIAIYLKDTFRNLGLIVEEDKASELSSHEANNLICTLKGTIDHPSCIFFSSHMDTVTPGVDIKPIIENEMITSDGTTILGADDKAGIAVMIEAIHLLKEQNIQHGDIQFIITVGEESGLAGAKVIDKSLIKATAGYVLDSDGEVGNLVTQAPFQTKFNIQFYGKKAHAGIAPEKGISAISIASKAISKMKLGRIDEETTANISYFQGGKKDETNIVTDAVYVEGEARSLKEEKLNDVLKQIEHAVNETINVCGGKATFHSELMYPGFKLDDNHKVVQIAQHAADKLNLSSTILKSGGGSDANIFNGLGFPTANLSVGYEHIHTTKERIHTNSLISLTKWILEIINETYK